MNGATETGTVTVTVNAVNGPPVLTLPEVAQSITEGDSVTLDTLIGLADPDSGAGDLTLTVSTPNGTFSVSGSPAGSVSLSGGDQTVEFEGTLAEITADLALVSFGGVDADPSVPASLTFDMTVTVTDNFNTGALEGTDDGTIGFSATDVGPTVMLSSVDGSVIGEGTEFTLTVGPASDPATLAADPLTAGSVSWGDGQTTPLSIGQISTLNAGGSIDLAPHTYTDDVLVTNPIRVTLFSAGIATGFQSAGVFPITVNNVAPTASVSINGPFDEGDTNGTVDLLSIFDPSSEDTANLTFSYDFDNDGIFEIVDTAQTSVAIPDSLLADDFPAFLPIDKEITVVVKDDDGGQTSYTTAYVVNNVDPLINQPTDGSVQKDANFTRLITFSDPGADTWNATVDFGDGSSLMTYADVGKSFNIDHVFTAEGTFTVTVTVTDDDGGVDTKAFDVEVTAVPASVQARHIFYNRSVFDGTPSGSATDGSNDDAAIATDKVALLPGVTASAANYTSYLRGINGVMIDIANLPAAGLTSDDFEFHVGNSNDPDSWSQLATPGEQPTIEVRAGEGVGGSDRIELIWPDNMIENQWLKVTVKANESTGLLSPDVHYWGNQIGDTENGVGNAIVDNSDLNGVFLAKGPSSVGIEDNYDINRDGVVDNSDLFGVFFNKTSSVEGDSLVFFTPPTPVAPLMASMGSVAGVDSVFSALDDDDEELLSEIELLS
ncbi:PKD domain-containing protein [Rhodopirellula baltica]|uniref:Protein containing PKD domain n=1 Tax=Rhodopirellula baltica WH47 TaxID=991778 RepID=F2AS89_RHOBT|nr:PKD domain-containing protein [Rhodopirellula baltica]EGF27475.1 protein containing PKD domain [Rhodopirellula baltica WH47]